MDYQDKIKDVKSLEFFKNIKNVKLNQIRVAYWSLVGLLIIFIIIRPVNQAPAAAEIIETNSDVITFSTDTPDENPPSEDFVWNGASEDPKHIRIPAIGVDGFIQKVGVDQNTQIAVPNNIHFAGWFVDSVRPGQKGLSILDGHVDGYLNPGIFRKLPELKATDEFEIEMGDGTIYKYKVKDVVTVDLDKAAQTLFSQDFNISSQLNLITCVGTFIEDQGTYNQRVIVISELIL